MSAASPEGTGRLRLDSVFFTKLEPTEPPTEVPNENIKHQLVFDMDQLGLAEHL